MEEIIDMLYIGDYSCVIANREIRTFGRPGVTDLYDLFTSESHFLQQACIADKVIGKAAAALLILGGVKEVYADVISLSALMLLRNAGIPVNFGRVVPFIQNRAKTGWCPLERICYNEKSAEAIFLLVHEFIATRQKIATI